MAGPQFDRSQSIELRVCEGGFTTSRAPDLRIDGDTLVAGRRRRSSCTGGQWRRWLLMPGSVRPLRDVYAVGPDVGTGRPARARLGGGPSDLRAFELGDRAMQTVAPDRPRVLWPEHFDVRMDRDEVNYGCLRRRVLPRALRVRRPVGPSRGGPRPTPRTLAFWNAPFGASRTIRALGDEAGVLAFFEEGMQPRLTAAAVRGHRPASASATECRRRRPRTACRWSSRPCSAAYTTAATSARGICARSTCSAAVTLPVGGSSVRLPGLDRPSSRVRVPRTNSSAAALACR